MMKERILNIKDKIYTKLLVYSIRKLNNMDHKFYYLASYKDRKPKYWFPKEVVKNFRNFRFYNEVGEITFKQEPGWYQIKL